MAGTVRFHAALLWLGLLVSQPLQASHPMRVVFIQPAHAETGFWQQSTDFMQAVAEGLGIALEVVYLTQEGAESTQRLDQRLLQPEAPHYLVAVAADAGLGDLLRRVERSDTRLMLIHAPLSQPAQRQFGLPREVFTRWIGHSFWDQAAASRLVADYRSQDLRIRQLGRKGAWEGERENVDHVAAGDDPAVVSGILDGRRAVAVSGSVFEAGWALIYLYDYHHGHDFADYRGVRFAAPMQLITRSNAAAWQKLLHTLLHTSGHRLDYSRLTHAHQANQPGLTGYPSLLSLPPQSSR